MEVMEDPVMDHCAHNFERRAICDWLQGGQQCCPISRKPLLSAELIPNHRLAERIERWKWQCESGLVDWEASAPESRSVDSDEAREVEDLERGDRRARKAKRSIRKQRQLPNASSVERYESLPKVDLMLLPQERVLLDKVRLQTEREQLTLRRSVCYRRIWWMLFVICFLGVLSGALYLRRSSSSSSDATPENP
jgi:U-box domain